MAIQLETQVHQTCQESRANRYPICKITYNRDAWVKLLQLPSEYAADEAKLLCQESADTWVAWVPSHGQITLHKSNFYC